MFTTCLSPWECTVVTSLIRCVSKGLKEMCMTRIVEGFFLEGQEKTGSVLGKDTAV